MAQPPPVIGYPPGQAPPQTGFDPLVVEVDDPLGGPPRVRGWLGNDVVVTQPVNGMPEAELGATLYSGWLVNDGTPDNPAQGRIDELLPDDALITIRTDRPNPAENFVLFRGYAERLRYSGALTKAAAIHCRHLFSVTGERSEDALVGQLRYDLDGLNRIDAGATDVLPVHYVGLPCVLNPEGAQNCRPNATTLNEIVDGQAQPRALSVFTDARDAQRQSWSWARWFLYLLFWPRRHQAETEWGNWTEHELRDLNLAELIMQRQSHLVDPDNPGDPPTHPWDRVMWAKPVSHAVDGMSWLEALDWTCARSGVGYHVEDYYDSQGMLRTGLRFFVPGADLARRRMVLLPSQAYTTHDRDWEDVRADANVHKLEVVSDRSTIINALRPVGGEYRYEVTVELVPMWAADAMWDVDPADQQAVDDAVAAIGGAAWSQRYHRAGSSHLDYVLVGRLWGLPDYGDFSMDRSRPWAPWTADRYERYDYSALRIGELLDGTGQPLPLRNAARARPFEACLTARGRSTPFPPLVEVSQDSGATWRHLAAGVAVMRQTARIFLEIERPEDELHPATGVSIAESYIRGQLRVRITGVIRGDQGVDGPLVSSSLSLSRRAREAVQSRRSEMLQHLRDDYNGFGGGNSQFKGSTRPALEKKPEGWLAAASRRLEHVDRVRHKAVIVLPELTVAHMVGGFWIGYRPGDEVEAIVAEEGASIHDIPLAARMDEDYAIIAAVTHRYRLGAGGRDGTVYHTELRIEDGQSLVRLPGSSGG